MTCTRPQAVTLQFPSNAGIVHTAGAQKEDGEGGDGRPCTGRLSYTYAEGRLPTKVEADCTPMDVIL